MHDNETLIQAPMKAGARGYPAQVRRFTRFTNPPFKYVSMADQAA
jgi:hypothetical protein